MPEPYPVIARLEDQIAWYDRKSLINQRAFKWIKMIAMVAAAMIPFMAALNTASVRWIISGLGVQITVIEGVLHLNQYHQNWITYRSTCESLKHEKFLYLHSAAPYLNVTDPHTLLAERIESLVSQEHAKWASMPQQEITGQSAS